MNAPRLKTFADFWGIIEKEIHCHPVITDNPYCKWFKKGEANTRQIIDLFEQFAVFSKWFLLVQMMRMLNAQDLEAEAHARYILVNELGVGIQPGGSTEEQPFKTRWAHINWLRETATSLQLDAERLGSWESSTPSTREFIHGLEVTYGSKDGELGRGASYAIETWAAWGIGGDEESESNNFWKELVTGMEIYNKRSRREGGSQIPLDFFQYHFQFEKGHGDNVLDEMKTSFSKPSFDKKKFLKGGRIALEAIHTFWLGLDRSRKTLQ